MRLRFLLLPSLAVSMLGSCRSAPESDVAQYEAQTQPPSELAAAPLSEPAPTEAPEVNSPEGEPEGEEFLIGVGTGRPSADPASGPPASAGPAASGPAAQDPLSQDDLETLKRRSERRAFLTQQLIQAGDAKYDEGALEEALRHYAEALEVDPASEVAKSRLRRVEVALGDRFQGAAEFFQDALARETVRRAQARIAADQAAARGNDALRQGDYDAAVEAYREALVILRFHPLIATQTLDERIVQGQLDQALALQEEWRASQARRQAEAAEAEQEKREQEAADYRRERLTRLWRDSNQAFLADDYEKAENLVQQILLEDPGNEAALAMRETARAARHSATNARTRRDYREQWRRTFDELETLDVPQNDPLEFDLSQWRETVQRQPLEFSTTVDLAASVDREAVLERLERVRFAPRFVGADGSGSPLSEIAAFLQNLTGVNFLVSAKVEELGDEEKTIKLDLPERSVRKVLDLIQETSENLRWKVEDGVVKFVTKEEMTGGQVLRMFDVRDIIHPIPSFPAPEINIEPSDGLEPAEEEAEEREGLVVTKDALESLIRENIAPASWNDDPKNSVRITEQGTMVVYQTPEVLELIRTLLDDLREATGIMVDIQARFLKVEDNFLEDIGVDFRGLGQPGLGTNEFLNDFGDPATQSDLGKEIGQGSDLGAFYNEGQDGDIKGRVENLYDTALGDTDVLTGAGGLSFQWTYLNDLQMEMILRAVSKSERMELVTAPRLLVFNTARSNLAVLNQVAYVQDFDVEIAQAASIADPIVNVVQDGVILDVRPVVSADRRFILMELRPTVAVLKRPIINQATTLGSQNSVTIQLPELDIQRVRTTVPMPDGGTVMLGGLKISEKQDLRSGVPILNKIPVVRFLFERKGTYVTNRKLLILIKASIVIPSEIEPSATQIGLR